MTTPSATSPLRISDRLDDESWSRCRWVEQAVARLVKRLGKQTEQANGCWENNVTSGDLSVKYAILPETSVLVQVWWKGLLVWEKRDVSTLRHGVGPCITADEPGKWEDELKVLTAAG